MKKYMLFLTLLLIPIISYAENIKIESIIPKYDTNNKIIVGTPSENQDFNITFTGENQHITYELTIKNTSNYDIDIENINLNLPSSEYLNYKYTGLEDNTILKNEEKLINIEIETKEGIELNTKDNLNFTFDYKVASNNKGKIITDEDIDPTSDEEDNENSKKDKETTKEEIDSKNKEINPYTKDSIYIALAVLLLTIVFYLFIKKKNKILPIILLLFVIGGITFTFATNEEKNTFVFSGTINIEEINEEEICRIDINPNGGIYGNSTEITTYLVMKGTDININNTYRQGYIFVNWLTNDESPLLENHIIVNKDTVIKASWEEEIYYQLTIDPNGGVYENSKEITTKRLLNNTLFTPEKIEKDGYIFLYWMDEENNIITESLEITKDTTIRAIWTEPIKYTITINPNGGKYNNSEETYSNNVLAGEVISLENITRPGYDFIKWQLNDGEEYKGQTIIVDKDINLTAIWEKEEFYQLTIDPNGGIFNNSEEVYTAQIKKGTIINLTTTRDNYIFDKWTLNGNEEYTQNTIKIMDDTTLVANWLEGVARINQTIYPSVTKAIEASKSNDIIYLLKDTEEIITNKKIVTIDLDEHKITGNITNNGTLKILNGTLENKEGPAIINNSILTIGEDDLIDDKPNVSNDNISIIGTSIGIDQKGILNFYDGYIEGDVAINGGYDDTPDDYIVYIDHNTQKDCQKAYLINLTEYEKIESESKKAVAQTTTKGIIYYFNLQDAINTSTLTKYTIYAIRDFEAAYELSIKEDAQIIFDIKGFEVNTGNTITNDGTLTLTNSETGGILNNSIVITNNGILNINNINIKQTTPSNVINNNNIINIQNSTLTGLDGYGLYNSNTGIINIDSDSKIKSNKYGLYYAGAEKLILTSGNIYGITNAGVMELSTGLKVYNNGSSYGINNSGTLTNNGAEITSNGAYGIYSNGTFIMNSGSIKVESNHAGIYQRGGTGTINGGTILTKQTGIETQYGGTFTINDGTFTSTNSYPLYFGLYYSANITINGGTFEGETYGIYTSDGACDALFCSSPSGTVTINGGTITGKKYGIYHNSRVINLKGGTVEGNTYGIYNSSSTTVNIGTNDQNFNITSPVITGETYGLYNLGSINFYDGIIKGKTASNYNNFTSRPDGSVIKIETDGEYQKTYLIKQEDFLEVNGIKYNSFIDAVNSIETEGTIKVIKDADIGTAVSIPSPKVITIDLNNHQIRMTQTITNNSTLIITDSSNEKEGTITNTRTYGIYNSSSTLTIESGKVISNSNYAIYGYGGTLTINNGYIESTSTYASIYQRGGKATINNGTIIGKNTAIEGQYGGAITINEGTIESKTSYALYFGLYYSANHVINGGTINGKTYGIYTSDGACDALFCSSPSGTVTMNGGTVYGEKYGAYLYSRVLNLTGGTIKGGQYGVDVESKATINIGLDDNNLSTVSPVLVGSDYGLLSKGTATFFDGILMGKLAGYNASISKIPDATIINSETRTIDDEEYKVNYLKEQDDFVKVNDTYFNSVQKAIDEIEESGTIILSSSAATGAAATIPSGKTIIFDLNGNQLEMSQTINNNGNLKIIDSSENKTGLLKNIKTYAVNNQKTGVLEIDGGSINTTSSYGIYNYNGNLTMTSGKVTSSSYAIYNQGSTFTMNGGEVIASGNSSAIYQRSGTSTINNGKIQGYSYGYETQYGGTFTMNNGEIISTNGSAIYFGLYYSTNHTINGGTIKGKTYGLYLSEGSCDALFCSSPSGIVNMTGGTVYGEKDGAYIYSRILNVNGGTITGDIYGVEVQSRGTLNVGTNDETISTVNPSIVGDTYGIYNRGTTNYYDGILKGKTSGYNGVINNIPNYYMIINLNEPIDETTSYNVNILEEQTNFIRNKELEKDYNNLQDAINEAEENNTLLLTKNEYIHYSVSIPEGKKITFDLNANTLSTNKNITNNGTLNIINSQENNASLKTDSGNIIIINKGTLDVENITINNISTSAYAIENSKTLNLDNIIFNGANGFTNLETGTMTINESNITSTSTALRNAGILSLKNSEVSGTSYALYDASTKTIELESTTLTSTSYSLYHYSTSTITTNNITYNGNIYVNNVSSNLSINNSELTGTITNNGILSLEDIDINYTIPSSSSTYNVINNTKTINVKKLNMNITKDNTYSANTRGIYNKGNISFEGENPITINNTKQYGTVYAIYSDTNGIISNYKGHIKSNNSQTAYGIYLNDGKITFTSGTIEVNGAKTSYGIYVNNGEIEVGETTPIDDPTYGTELANVSQTDPYIIAVGTTTGIGVKKNNGKFKYYDGKLIGSTSAKPDTTTDVEYNYEATFYIDEETNYEYCVLEYLK